jgi:hypothetical protein
MISQNHTRRIHSDIPKYVDHDLVMIAYSFTLPRSSYVEREYKIFFTDIVDIEFTNGCEKTRGRFYLRLLCCLNNIIITC